MFKERYILAKEPDILSKEPYILSKEPYILSKEPYTLSKEPYILSKQPFTSLHRGLILAKDTHPKQHTHTPLEGQDLDAAVAVRTRPSS